MLRMVAKRHLELTALRTQAACRLHTVLAALGPGGMARRLSARNAAAMLGPIRPATPIGQQRKAMARQHLADIGRLDSAIAANKQRINAAVTASGTTLVEIRGGGPGRRRVPDRLHR